MFYIQCRALELLVPNCIVGGAGSNVSAEIEGLVSAQGSTSKGTGFFETLKAFR